MLDSICQAYHWSLKDVMRMTLPQIIMMNHAAWVNQERSERRYKVKREMEEQKSASRTSPQTAEELVIGNKKMSEMTSEEIARQLMNWE
jgi:hypothetical protein